MKTEKEKMLAGELYQAYDPELTQDRKWAKKTCQRINQHDTDDLAGREALLAELMHFEGKFWVEPPLYVDYGYNIHIGDNFYANHGLTILDGARVVIGKNVFIAPNVVIATAGHPLDKAQRAAGEEFVKPITIGDDVWLGAHVTLCPGVTLGNNVVVGAGSVVVHDLPDNSVCVGTPARPVKSLA
ncbi:sugar O-acetyltransferase [Chimaeribacter arupi]|uniref:Acetyltransferase n=1 Tax=Chimaeribacter arupi TaxID=2060066 RepID=A0A2N5ET36_9GAMM|nr:sugar O-acetyltransferase [Chimaeribacter arupi]PLR40033.1 galactoside O-acetyltransferase [Chimaeribacter arupi]PLR53262.1 galactoside O-acetyltransferase [Chimaeribacter arupi]WKZ90954.1 sugar O-acetyltransferase [Chimaeribacter arupi]